MSEPLPSPIIVIVVDDLMALSRLGAYGVPLNVVAPNLASYSTSSDWSSWGDVHCSVPACVPSRHSMWSGLAGHETGLTSNTDLPPYDETTYVMHDLQDLGARVIGAGKIFHSRKLATQPVGVWHRYEEEVLPQVKLTTGVQIDPFGGFGASPDLQSDEELVTRLIDSQIIPNLGTKSDGSPWTRKILFAGIYKPHLPFVVPQEHFDAIPKSLIQIPNQTNRPTAGSIAERFLAKEDNVEDLNEAGQLDEAIEAYLAAVHFADGQIARIIDAAPSDAHVIITSDHGYALGERDMLAKFAPWSQSTHVPFLIRSPLYPTAPVDPVSLTELPDIILALHRDDDSWAPNKPVITSIRDSWNTGAPGAGSGATAIAVRDRLNVLVQHTDGIRVERALYRATDTNQDEDLMGNHKDSKIQRLVDYLGSGFA